MHWPRFFDHPVNWCRKRAYWLVKTLDNSVSYKDLYWLRVLYINPPYVLCCIFLCFSCWAAFCQLTINEYCIVLYCIVHSFLAFRRWKSAARFVYGLQTTATTLLNNRDYLVSTKKQLLLVVWPISSLLIVTNSTQ